MWPAQSCQQADRSAWQNYSDSMIRSFRCPDTESLARGWAVPRFQAFERVARRKLLQLDIAIRLDDLRIPPGNRLEPLRGDREGQHSIRINDQFRLCFIWTEAGPEAFAIVDYH
jgi:proteic killer suppression protein